MPGVMSLRPVAASGKTGRRTSRLSEKIAEERERASTNFKAAKVHPIMVPVVVVGGNAGLANLKQVKQVKQVTDPWPEDVKARLVRNVTDKVVNYSSSGSEHEPSSNCLVAMVHEFMEKENELKKCGRARCNCEGGSCSGDAAQAQDDDSKSSLGGELCEVLQGMAPCVDEQETSLLAEVIKAMDVLKTTECATTLCRRRSVMKHLRSNGYNAALCKSRWDHAGRFPGGDYEYIDVISSETQSRLIVDIDFQSQFEIARPSSQYKHVYQALPSVYVGTTDRLLQILNVMTEAVKRSLKKKGMFLPPWRKPEYVKAKWFSSYKRTTNESSSKSFDSLSPNISLVAVRSVDWDKNFTREMEDQFEGAVRGANNLKQLWTDLKSDAPREIQEVDNMDWQPPALLPKTSSNRRTGLTLALREAGLIGSNSSPVAAM